MILASGHYCKDHNTKFYKNEKLDQKGELSVWYSHKKLDGSGFCVEPKQESLALDSKQESTGIAPRKQYDGLLVAQSHQHNSMYVCNAMNNAVSLAANGVIGVEQIGQYFQKIYGELSKVAA